VLQSYTEEYERASAAERKFITNRCLMALYFPLLLTTGYGFANDSKNIYVLHKIKQESPGISCVHAVHRLIGVLHNISLVV